MVGKYEVIKIKFRLSLIAPVVQCSSVWSDHTNHSN